MRSPRVMMLLGNGFAPDPRVRSEADALVRAGAHVTVVAWDRDGDLPRYEVVDGIHVHRIRLASTHGRGSAQALLMPRVWSEFVKLGLASWPDVVHAHDLDTLPAGWTLARRCGAALVFDAHESYPDMLAGNVAESIRGACRTLERLLVPRADLLVTVGDKLRRHYEAMGARDSVVVGNWRDPIGSARERARVRQAVRVESGVMDSSVFISFIANLTPERQLLPLLEAVEKSPDVHLAVGGRGAMAGAAEAAAARCPRIRYLGQVEPRDIPRWTAGADAVYYGFDPQNRNARFSAPNKLFEALAAGIPVITGRFGEIGEIVADTGCGLLLPEYTPGAIAGAFDELRDPLRRARLCAAARATAVCYTRRAADDILVDAYRRLANGRFRDLGTARGEAA